MTASHLPDRQRLVFGTATSAYQVEGSTEADGRGPSIWDTFTARPGTIADGTDGSVACGSYERVDDDLELVQRLGGAFHRFSLSWPRIVPEGSGQVEPRGFAYYERLVDGLLERGIQPLATLYHWDLPQPLEDAGGWPVRDTALRFADYAAAVHERLGDRVDVWATLNEPWCSAFLGYASGAHAPGRREPEAAFRAAHHLLLGHALAAQALRQRGEDTVGIALNLSPVWPERPEAEDAARLVDAIHNRTWLGPLVEGRYPDDLIGVAPVLAEQELVRDDDLAAIRGSIDWLGVNYYTPARVDVGQAADGGVGQNAAAYPGVESLVFRPRGPRTAMGWEIEPAGLEQLLLQTADRAPGVPLLVSENGAAFDDAERDADGIVDNDRIDYLDQHIAAVEGARRGGADVRGYLLWTLLDNFEWAEGYRMRFGLVEIEDKTLRRVPKRSFAWYADRIRRD